MNSPDPSDTASTFRPTVLLVEDQPALRELSRRVLGLKDLEVLSCADGEEGWQTWTENAGRIHLVVTDLSLPGGMSGEDLIIRLLQSDPHLPILIHSGSGPRDYPGILDLPGVRFLRKPCSPMEMLQLVDHLLLAPQVA